MQQILMFGFLFLWFSCKESPKNETLPPLPVYKSGEMIGVLEKFDGELDSIIVSGVQAEVLATGFDWSEGPLWLEDHNKLIFSDVPRNKIYQWTALRGAEVYLEPSGYTKEMPSESGSSGSNGLALDTAGNLLICQHGNRSVVRMESALDKAAPMYKVLAKEYGGKRLNSPNDLAINSRGEIFFTDPPYGLPSHSDQDKTKEIPFNGIYKIKTNGEIVLLIDSITRPNGIALFPGEKQLLVANSDATKPNWYLWDIVDDSLKNGRIFYSLAGYDKNMPGLPDGLKIDSKGNVYASGPGGIYFFNKEGKKLGLFRLEYPASNIALSDDERILYITNDDYVLRLEMRKLGSGFRN
jgi:gluconolactonase